MADNDTTPIVIKPVTPLGLLPPAIAGQYQTASYIVVASFSAFVWDWITSIAQEYEVVCSSSRLNLPIVTYFLSRIGTVNYLIAAGMLTSGLVASVQYCQALLRVGQGSSILGMCSTSLLFFYRVRAVYGKSKLITYVFGFLWVAIFGMSFVFPFSDSGVHIGPTERCFVTSQRSYTFMPVIANAIYDTLVFLAISHRIISYTTIGDSWSSLTKSFFSADGLPRLSRALLQSGQQFYFATIGLSISFSVMLLVPGVPATSRVMLSVPSLALASAMGCRVYRAVKLGLIEDTPSTNSLDTLQFNSSPRQSDHELSLERPISGESLVDMTNLGINTGYALTLQENLEAYDCV